MMANYWKCHKKVRAGQQQREELCARKAGNQIATTELRAWLHDTDAPDWILSAFNRLCAEARRGERVPLEVEK